MEKWNDDWRAELKEKHSDIYERLCDCRNKKSDIIIIAKYIYSYNKSNYGKKDCLDRAITWITDWNNQVELIPTNYDWYLRQI